MTRTPLVGLLCLAMACSGSESIDVPGNPPPQQQWELSPLDRVGYEWEFIPTEGSLADCGEIGLRQSESAAMRCCAEHFREGKAFRVRFKERSVYLSDLGPSCSVVDRVLLGNERGDLRIEGFEPLALGLEYRVRNRSYAVHPGFPLRAPWLRSTLELAIDVPKGEDSKGTVRVVVGPEGDVIHCWLSKAGGAIPPALETSVCSVASRLSYTPATVFGLPVKAADEFHFERTGAQVILSEIEKKLPARWD